MNATKPTCTIFGILKYNQMKTDIRIFTLSLQIIFNLEVENEKSQMLKH